MREFKWETVEGTKIPNIAEYIKEYIRKDELTSEFKIYVGCDSQPRRFDAATYVTVVCIYKVGRGAHVVFSRDNNVKIYGKAKGDRLKNRLWDEVYRVVDIASILTDSDLFENKKITAFEVHLDVNPNENFESNVIHTQAMGYIKGMGFDAFAKPDSPAASYASDHVCRGKEKKMAGHGTD